MNKLNLITGLLAALIVVLAALGGVCGAVVSMAFDAQLYDGLSRQAVSATLGTADEAQIAAHIGMDAAQQTAFAREITAFMKGETDVQPAVLNEKEQQHMLDVRSLVLLSQSLAKGCTVLAAALAVIAAWTGAGRKKPFLLGAFAGCGVLIFAALFFALALQSDGFEALFVRFHEIFFTNDLWLMNPDTDILIRMMPQLLFERAAQDVIAKAAASFAVTAVMLGAVYTVFSGLIRRHLTERTAHE